MSLLLNQQAVDAEFQNRRNFLEDRETFLTVAYPLPIIMSFGGGDPPPPSSPLSASGGGNTKV